MAPVVCLSEIPTPGGGTGTCPYPRRRQRNNSVIGISEKHEAVQIKQMIVLRARACTPHSNRTLPHSPISEPDKPMTNLGFPNSPEASLCSMTPIDRDDNWVVKKRREDLLKIVIRTIALVRRNHILEKKIRALRLETRSFITSLLENPENESQYSRWQPITMTVVRTNNLETMHNNDNVTSSTDAKLKRPMQVPDTVEKKRQKIFTDFTHVTSSCNLQNAKRKTRSTRTIVR